MCLAVLAIQQFPGLPLVLAHNRDEYFARPSEPAHVWDGSAGLLAGRDLKDGGTWLGVTRTDRLAFITNFRDLARTAPDRVSRGGIVRRYLEGADEPGGFIASLHEERIRYNPFNLFAAEGVEVHVYESVTGERHGPLPPGIYVISNALLDTPWPKVERARRRAAELVQKRVYDPEALFALLRDETRADPATLPETGLPPDLELALSSAFIALPEYGTRASTVVTRDDQGDWTFEERTHLAGQPEAGRVQKTSW